MNIYSDYLFDFFMFAQKTRAGSGGFVSSFTVDDVGVLGDLQICVNRKDEEATTRIVKSLMWTLMKREYKGKGESMYQDPFMQFLIGASIQRDGRLRLCRDITHIVAALQYIFRLFFLDHCSKTAENDGAALIEWVTDIMSFMADFF